MGRFPHRLSPDAALSATRRPSQKEREALRPQRPGRRGRRPSRSSLGRTPRDSGARPAGPHGRAPLAGGDEARERLGLSSAVDVNRLSFGAAKDLPRRGRGPERQRPSSHVKVQSENFNEATSPESPETLNFLKNLVAGVGGVPPNRAALGARARRTTQALGALPATSATGAWTSGPAGHESSEETVDDCEGRRDTSSSGPRAVPSDSGDGALQKELFGRVVEALPRTSLVPLR